MNAPTRRVRPLSARLSAACSTAFAAVLLLCSASESALTLTQVPAGMRKQGADITVGWTGGLGRVHLRASTAPGGGASIARYDSLHLPSQDIAGTYTFRINPDIPAAYRNTDLRFGVNYCILTDGTQISPEFTLIVESGVAPVLASPANSAAIKDLTPTFSWSGSAPYYALLVSDEPFKISEDGTVSGVSAIWQIITPYTSARYGDPDPSGYNTVPAPPLISGKTYNWLVLNNYGNNAAATSKVAPTPSAFVYSPAPPLPKAQPIAPADMGTVAGLDAIDFRWSLVEGAVSYKLEILEENLVDGSQADVVIWKASSTGGQIRMENASSILRRYTYKWRVYAVGNSGSASLSDKRSFFYDIPVGKITLALRNDKGQKLAYLPVKVSRLGGASSAAFQNGSTDADGGLSIDNAPLGNYEARVENADGYQAKADTFSHVQAAGTSHTLTLKPVLGKILGKVASASGTGLLNAKVVVTASDGTEWTALSNSQGYYSLGVPFGTWQAKALKDGFQASGAVALSLNSTAPTRTADFALAPFPYTLSGAILNAFSKQGVFGATVYLTSGAGTRAVNTDGNGAYAFPVPAGAFTLRASSPGYAAPEPLALSVSGDRVVNLSLDPNASILTGRSKDASGTAVPGAVIQAAPKAGPIRSVIADGQGAFELSLPAGDWALSASAKGYTAKTVHAFLLDMSKTVQGVDFVLEANRSALAGRVTENGAGLSGVRVTAGSASGLTDNGGYYQFSVSAGTQQVSARKDGYLIPKTYAVPVNAGETVSGIDFSATGNAGILRGKVLSGGAGVLGARVEAVNKASREAFAAATDGDGAYALSLPQGEYVLSASKEGFAPERALDQVLQAGGTVLDANLRLLPDQGTLQGTVTGGASPLGGCEVSYRKASDGSLSGRTVTDPQGRYSLSLQAGTAYALAAACAGYQGAASTTGTLPRGGALTADFNLSAAGSRLSGRVADRRGALAGVQVAAVRDGAAVSALSDFSGQFQLDLGSGAYTLTFSKSGYRTRSVQVQLAPGANLRAADTLIAALGRLSGRINADGAGVAGALVALVGLTPDAGGGVYRTDADGRFSQDGLPAGSYSLTASADGYSEGKVASLTVVADELTVTEAVLIQNRSSLSGTVEISGASPTAVKVVADGNGVSRSAVPAAGGAWTIDKLPAGQYTVAASLIGYSADGARTGLNLGASAALGGIKFTLTRNAGSLSGTVSGAGSAAGIRINLTGAKGGQAYGTCDAAGKYSIPSLPEDQYTLTVTAPGYRLAGASQEIKLSIGSAQTRDLALEPALFRVAGKVVNQTGLAIAGLPVELRHPSDRVRTATGSDGGFAFADVPAGGEYQVSFKPPTAEYDPKDTVFSRSLSETSAAAVNLSTISRRASLAGTVTLDGSPVEGVPLRLAGRYNNQVALSQPGGAYKFAGVAGSEETVSLQVSMAGAGAVDTQFVIRVGEARTGFDIRLKTIKVSLSGLIEDSEGKPLPGARAVLSGGARLDTVTANSSGAFTAAGLAANQTLSLITLLDKARYDNVEVPVRLRESDTSVTVAATVHASVVTITVKDQDAAAVPGAEVVLDGKSLGLTGSGGALQARNLARGEYRLAAGKASYRGSPEARLKLGGDTAAALTLTVTKVVGGLYGTVSDTGLDGSGGAAMSRTLPGAVVTLAAGADTLRDTANSLGQYFVDGLSDGRSYVLSVVLPGYAPLRETVTGTSQAQSRNLTLRPFPGSLVGRVETGKSGVVVRLHHAAGGRIHSFATVAGGYYGFLNLQNRNDYLVQAEDGTTSSQALPVQGAGGAAKRVDLALEARGRIAGKVTGASAAALPGVTVKARHLLTGAESWTLSGADGTYALPGLAAGEYSLQAERLGFRSPAPRALTLAKGSTAAADLSLEEADAGIAGVALDEAGRPVPALITLAADGDTSRTRAGGGGQFLFAGLAAGAYSLSAQEGGYTPTPEPVDYSGKGLALAAPALDRFSAKILGTLRDAITNTPLAGAAVRVAGTSGADAATDSAGRYLLHLDAGTPSPILLEVSKSGYLTRTSLPVYRDADGSALQDLALTADYRKDGEISVVVREGRDTLQGLILSLVPFHPDDAASPGLSGKQPFAFRNLRRPAPYTLKVKRDGYKELSKVVELTAGSASLPVVLSYPTSRIRVFVTDDGRQGRGVEVSLDGQRLEENADTAGLYLSAARIKPGRYEATVRDLDAGLIPMASHFIDLGEDSIRTDTLFLPFRKAAIADSTIESPLPVRLVRTDSARPLPGVEARLFYRPEGASHWDSLALDSAAGGFAGTLPGQERAGDYEYFHRVTAPAGVRIGVETGEGGSRGAAPMAYSDFQSPSRFRLRDPFLLQAMALAPQRLEADTSLYSLGARDLWQVHVRGENGRSLDAFFDGKAAAGDTAYSVAWSFADGDLAGSLGLSLEPDSASPRLCRFRGGSSAREEALQVACDVRMGAVRMRKTFLVRIQDLSPVSVGIRYVKENRLLEPDGASLQLANDNAAGYAFSAFALTADGRSFNIAPRWSIGEDSAAGSLDQQGLFVPDPAVARGAVLRIDDTLSAGGGERKPFTFRANLATFAQVTPGAQGRSVITDGEGTVLDFNRAGLAKAFTVSVRKPKVSGLMQSSSGEEVVGEILDIELSESQPFKADSGALLRMPVAGGIARRSTVFLGHWNSARLVWEKVAETKADTAVEGTVYGFSKYAVLMGSLPLGAYDIVAKPNPFSAHDPWGLQLGYKVSSDVSALVGVRVEVYNMLGDKVYESQEVQLSKGQAVEPGTHKADPRSPERRLALGPFVWDGRDTKGELCRNGRYLLKLVVRDGSGRKEYLKKVVMLK